MNLIKLSSDTHHVKMHCLLILLVTAFVGEYNENFVIYNIIKT